MNRRHFLTSSLTALGYLAVGKQLAFAASYPIGLQMYTLRDQAEKDLPGVLAAVKKIGIQELELYWNLYSRPAKELKQLIADQGLTAPSGHLDYDGFETKLDYAKEVGFHYVICPMLPKSMWNSLDDFKKAAEQFNKWGEKVNAMGMRFGFHNHNYEFKDFGGQTGWDAIVKGTDPKLVVLEMDCYWITQAGRNPVEMLNSLHGRVKCIHVKDRKPGAAPSQELNDAAMHFTEVGTGAIDYKKVLAAAEKNGVEHYFLEQDFIEGPALASVATSYKNLKRLMA